MFPALLRQFSRQASLCVRTKAVYKSGFDGHAAEVFTFDGGVAEVADAADLKCDTSAFRWCALVCFPAQSLRGEMSPKGCFPALVRRRLPSKTEGVRNPVRNGLLAVGSELRRDLLGALGDATLEPIADVIGVAGQQSRDHTLHLFRVQRKGRGHPMRMFFLRARLGYCHHPLVDRESFDCLGPRPIVVGIGDIAETTPQGGVDGDGVLFFDGEHDGRNPRYPHSSHYKVKLSEVVRRGKCGRVNTEDPLFDPVEMDRVTARASEWIRQRERAGFDMTRCFPARRLAERAASRDAEKPTKMKT